MPIAATKFAIRTRQSVNWGDARFRVLKNYREWMRAAPEIQSMYTLPVSVANIRNRVRQEFERHRFVNKLPVVDVLLLKSHTDYQEMMNFWKQTTHLMSYFKEANLRSASDRLPNSFMQAFLEGRN